MVANCNHMGGLINPFKCRHDSIFSNVGLCAACWARFMWSHELWPTPVSQSFSFSIILLVLFEVVIIRKYNPNLCLPNCCCPSLLTTCIMYNPYHFSWFSSAFYCSIWPNFSPMSSLSVRYIAVILCRASACNEMTTSRVPSFFSLLFMHSLS